MTYRGNANCTCVQIVGANPRVDKSTCLIHGAAARATPRPVESVVGSRPSAPVDFAKIAEVRARAVAVLTSLSDHGGWRVRPLARDVVALADVVVDLQRELDEYRT